jgi:hypothetical protein
MLQCKTLLNPMYDPASNDSTLYALIPFAPTLYILAFDPAPYSPNSMLLFLTPLLPMLLLRIPLHPMFLLPNGSTLYALLPMLLLPMSLLQIPLPVLLIQCSCSLCLCSLCACALYPLYPMLPSTLAFAPSPYPFYSSFLSHMLLIPDIKS